MAISIFGRTSLTLAVAGPRSPFLALARLPPRSLVRSPTRSLAPSPAPPNFLWEALHPNHPHPGPSAPWAAAPAKPAALVSLLDYNYRT